ncbi:hypothetical protein PFISCL1PPCAC_7994, partial [Pristionchus fissidentatus]
RAVTRLYSTLFLLGLSLLVSTSEATGRIHCGNALFCFPNTTSNEFEFYNRMSAELALLMRKSADQNITSIAMVEGSPLFRKLTEGRKFLCNDFSMTGFLLDENVKNWTTQCVWNGRDYNGICMPAPLNPASVFYYIKKEEWKKRLVDFRAKIGCSAKEIQKAESSEEQFVCRERCMQ